MKPTGYGLLGRGSFKVYDSFAERSLWSNTVEFETVYDQFSGYAAYYIHATYFIFEHHGRHGRESPLLSSRNQD